MKTMSKAMYGKTMMKKSGTKKPLRKAQDGIEMNDDMINKAGSTGGYKKPMRTESDAYRQKLVNERYNSAVKESKDNLIKQYNDAIQKRDGYTNTTEGEMRKFPPMKKGGTVKKYERGGRVISQKAAARKSAKGKGFTSSIMGANPSGDKGMYVPYTRQGRKDAKETGKVSSKEMKPSRKIMKTGGAKKK
jgi:hypothetical protein